eukprot:1117908_1
MVISSSVKWIATTSQMVINYFIFVPFVLSFLVRFVKKRHKMIIFKRYPQLVICINILAVITLIFHRPVQILLTISPLRDSKPSYTYYLGTSWNVIYFFVHLVIWLYLARFWLMFYDLMHGNSSLNSRWKFYLDPQLDEGDFWTKHPHLGSTKWILKIATVLWLCTAFLWAVPYQMSLKVDFVTNGKLYTLSMLLLSLTHFVAAIFCTVLWFKTPRISDIFYLRFELKILTIIVLGVNIWWIVLIIVQFLVNKNHSQSSVLIYGLKNIQTISGSVFYTLYASASTTFVLYKNKIDQNNKTDQSDLVPSFSHSPSGWGAKGNLWNTLLHREYFEFFVQHLCREFSVETILCFVELMQFKEIVMETFNLNPNMDSNPGTSPSESLCIQGANTQMHALSRNPKIPKSHIIYSAMNDDIDNESQMETCLKMVYLLFWKYINDTNCSDLEINISGQMRQRYMDDFKGMGLEAFIDKNTMEPMALFEYFDDVIEELYQLLLLSLGRFWRTDIKVAVSRLVMKNRTTEELEHFVH